MDEAGRIRSIARVGWEHDPPVKLVGSKICATSLAKALRASDRLGGTDRPEFNPSGFANVEEVTGVERGEVADLHFPIVHHETHHAVDHAQRAVAAEG